MNRLIATLLAGSLLMLATNARAEPADRASTSDASTTQSPAERTLTSFTVDMLYPAVKKFQTPQTQAPGSGQQKPSTVSAFTVPDGVGIEVQEPAADGPRIFRLLTLDNPAITNDHYAVIGDISYEDVEGDSYLELRSTFSEGEFFTRTLRPQGPMMRITGSSVKRSFRVPFAAVPGRRPSKLVLNLVLRGRGTVAVSNVKLVEPIAAPPITTPGAAATSSAESSTQAAGEHTIYTFDDFEPAMKAANSASPQSIRWEKLLSATQPAYPGYPAAAPSRQKSPLDVVAVRKYVQVEVNEASTAPRTIWLAALDNPGVSSDQYAIVGEVFYVNVEGDAYLEMWSHFPDGSAHFSRTLAAAGPMMKISDTSSRRAFRLPFTTTGQRPNKLVLDLVMPGRGKVTLNDVRLVEIAGAAAPIVTPSPTRFAWLDGRLAVSLGALVGVLALLAIPLRSLSRRGRGRTLMTGIFAVMTTVGVAELFVAAVAIGADKPPRIVAILLAGGAIGIATALLVLSSATRQYKQFELRKLAAMDVA